jgi:hypothetical protein
MASFGGTLGDSMTSLVNQRPESPGVEVLTQTWETFADLPKSGPVSLLKIDIEGGEFALVPKLAEYLAEHKPVVYLSLHAPFLAEEERRPAMERVLAALAPYGQCLGEDLQPVDRAELLSERGLEHFPCYVFCD